MIIYLDESGDLGFDLSKEGTSQNFVITLLVCADKQIADGFKVAVKRTLKNKLNTQKKNKRIVHELKGTNTTLLVKHYFYNQLPTNGWQIYTVILNKWYVHKQLDLLHNKKKLYNFLARFILKKVDFQNSGTEVTLIMDRCKNSKEIKEFNTYIANQLEAHLPLQIPLNIKHDISQENKGLQAVDLFCWGIYRKYESEDEQWYSIFQNAIVNEETKLE